MTLEHLADSASSDSTSPIGPVPRRSDVQLQAASNRLWYEYWMLRCAARAGSDDPVVSGALEESFALHLRNLHTFLFAADTSENALNAKDFLGTRWPAMRPELSPLLAEALVWAEQVTRRPAYTLTESAAAPRFWSLVQASFELQKVMDVFISSLPRNLLGARWKIQYDNGYSV